MESELIKETDTANFAKDVMEASLEKSVFVLFFMSKSDTCVQLETALAGLLGQSKGNGILVKIDINKNPEIAMHMQIGSVPTTYVFKQGKPVDGFHGLITDNQLKAFVEKQIGELEVSEDSALEEAKLVLKAGKADQAERLYGHLLEKEPDNKEALAGVIESICLQGELGRASALIGKLSEEEKAHPALEQAIAGYELAAQGETVGAIEELKALVKMNGSDYQARFDLSLAYFANEDAQLAIDELLEIVRQNKAWDDDKARRQLLKVFDALGNDDPRTVQGRKRLSSLLFA